MGLLGRRAGRAATIIPRWAVRWLQLLHDVGVLRRQGKVVTFFDRGADLFEVMCHAEKALARRPSS